MVVAILLSANALKIYIMLLVKSLLMSIQASMIGFVEEIATSRIKISSLQLREQLDDINGLIFSIKEHGLLEPIIVRPQGSHFEVVAGNRRFTACKNMGWRKIPCHIISLEDREAYEVSLVENVQRRTLSPVEEAKAYRNYVSIHGWGGVSELARKIGKSQEYVSKRLRLLDLPQEVLEQIIRQRITPSIGEELLQIEDDEERKLLGIMVANTNMTRAEVREIVKFSCINTATRNFVADDLKVKALSRALRRVIAALQISLARMDRVIEDIGEDWIVREFLMQHRMLVHDQISSVIRFKKRIEKPVVRDSQTNIWCGLREGSLITT
jgi:ParB family chromosome partitioning protein